MMKRSIGFSYILEPYLLGLSCLIGTDQFEILFHHSKDSLKFQYVILVTTSILTLIGCGIINLENNFIFNLFYFSYTVLLVVIHLARSRFGFSILFGIIFLVLGFFLLELKTDNFANYFILHVGVLHFLLIVFVKDRIYSSFIITLHTICIGYSMTLIIVYSCSYYSKYKSGLLWFINGLFSALLLPSILWYFLSKTEYHDINMQSFSENLALFRFLFCFISFLMKHTMGKAKFYIKSEKEIYFLQISESFQKAFKEICEYFPKISDHFCELSKHVQKVLFCSHNTENKSESNHKFLEKLIVYLAKFFKLTTFLFMFSCAIVLKKSPLIHLLFYPYSNYQKIILYTIMRASYLIGSCFGVAYPASETENHYSYYIITFLVFLSNIVISVTLSYIGQFLSLNTLYALASLLGFALGYTFSYSLGAFANSLLIQTCIREEFDNPLFKSDEIFIPCCGDKFNNECYCKYPSIIPFHEDIPNPFRCSKTISLCNQFQYDPEGKCAIIICLDDATLAECCKTTCNGNCCTSNNCKCLGLVGIFKLDAVTTSVCGDCQLTVRLEGRCSYKSSKCSLCSHATSGEQTMCNGQNCCLCVKCCSGECCASGCTNGNCCCVKFCCCGENCRNCQGKCNCKKMEKGKSCNHVNGNNKSGKCICEIAKFTTRVFICFKNCAQNQNSCFLREIKPNTVDFDGVFGKSIESDGESIKWFDFDIKRITLSYCCHVDMRIDLECSLKNNYFRLKGVNYPRKFDESKFLLFYGRMTKPCKNSEKPCCCLFRDINKLRLSYEDCKPEENCCQTDSRTDSRGSCTCPECLLFCKLKLNKASAFVERVDKFRVKIIVISFLLFGLVYLTVLLYTLIIEVKNIPKNFDPRATYDRIAQLTEKKKFNSIDLLSERLTSLINVSRMAENVTDEKITHLKKINERMKRYLSDNDHVKLFSYLDSVSSTFLSRSNRSEFRSMDKQLILWSHCVGMFYAYAYPLFIVIQKFFIRWETMWNVEHKNYIRLIQPKLNKISHTSRYSLSLLNVLIHTDKTVKSIGISRKLSWINVKEELRLLTELNKIEKELDDQQLPESMGERLEYYLNLWQHRRRYLGNWIVNKTNVFNWEGFRADYENIEDWIEILSPYLKLGNEYFNIPLKEFNKGTEIYGKPIEI